LLDACRLGRGPWPETTSAHARLAPPKLSPARQNHGHHHSAALVAAAAASSAGSPPPHEKQEDPAPEHTSPPAAEAVHHSQHDSRHTLFVHAIVEEEAAG